MPDADSDRTTSHTPREDTHSGSPEHPDDDLTADVSLEEFFDEGEPLPGQNPEGDPDAPANSQSDPDGYEEEEYLHLDIDFDDDPYELPADIQMTTPMGRDDAAPEPPSTGPTMPTTRQNDFDLDNIEEFATEDSADSQA